MNNRVAIIDIGSNSIKLLVASKAGTLFEDIRGVRIGEGIGESKEGFNIKAEVIQKNVTAIKELFEEAQHFKPDLNIITGTSAVRDALNSADFCKKVQEATGVTVRVLSGEEEALIIAKGVATDPNIQVHKEFCLFDLGGGSLECIHYKAGKILLAQSLSLGIVRLTEKYITNPLEAVSNAQLQKIKEIIENEVTNFPIKGVPLVGTGGGLSTAKNILKTDSIIKITDLEDLLDKLSKITVVQRIREYKIPAFRADLMPVALTIIITLAHKANANAIIHSSFNLRFGLAEEALENMHSNSLKRLSK